MAVGTWTPTDQSRAQALPAPTDDSLFYYRIGGGRDITLPPSLTITTLDLSFSAQQSALSCQGFDPLVSIESSLDDVRQGVDNALNAIEVAATAAIANLPGYILQKANPGLYDLFQNALLRANESFALATKSCERIQYEISRNTNPFDEWVTISWGDSWKRSVGLGEPNIHDALDAAADAPDQGIPWIGGQRRGGQNQAPIEVLTDVATAGLNLLSDRPPDSQQALPTDAPWQRHFADPEAVEAWMTEILGDVSIRVCSGCSQGARPGKGLIPAIQSMTDTVVTQLNPIVSGTHPPTRDNLNVVAAPGIAVTHQVIEAIQALPGEEQGLMTHRLAQDIAEARLMEQAMLVRRLLLAGRREGNVAANHLAQRTVDQALAELEQEIETVLFEKRARQQWVSSTVTALLQRDYAERQTALTAPTRDPSDPRPLNQGSVPR